MYRLTSRLVRRFADQPAISSISASRSGSRRVPLPTGGRGKRVPRCGLLVTYSRLAAARHARQPAACDAAPASVRTSGIRVAGCPRRYGRRRGPARPLGRWRRIRSPKFAVEDGFGLSSMIVSACRPSFRVDMAGCWSWHRRHRICRRCAHRPVSRRQPTRIATAIPGVSVVRTAARPETPADVRQAGASRHPGGLDHRILVVGEAILLVQYLVRDTDLAQIAGSHRR